MHNASADSESLNEVVCILGRISLFLHTGVLLGIWFQKWDAQTLAHLHTYSLEDPLLTAAVPLTLGGKQTLRLTGYSTTWWVGVTALLLQPEARLEPCFTSWGPQALDIGVSLFPIPKGLLAGEEYVGHRLCKGMAWVCPAVQPWAALPKASGSPRARTHVQGWFRCSNSSSQAMEAFPNDTVGASELCNTQLWSWQANNSLSVCETLQCETGVFSSQRLPLRVL